MDIRQLEYFYAVAKHENFSVAAQELYVAQPALSRAVKRLEDELETQLFIRKGKSVHLSPSGRELKTQLEQILPSYYSLPPRLAEFEKKNVKQLNLSLHASVAYSYGPIEKFKKSHPDTVISVGRSQHFFDFDVKFSFGILEQENHIKIEELEVFLLAAKGSKWDGCKNISIQDIANENRIENVVSKNLQRNINQYLEASGVPLKPSTLKVCESNIMCYFVEKGYGIILSPDFPDIFDRYNICLCPFENHRLTVPLYLSWSNSSYITNTTRDFIYTTCEYYNVKPPAQL